MASSPKYMEIVSWSREQITQGAFLPGDRFLSEAALCERFAVSRQTVRRALRELAEAGHVGRIQGSGTYIAEGSLTRPSFGNTEARIRSKTVGIISLYLDDYIFPGIIRGIEGVLASNGYGMLLASTQNEIAGETRALKRMLESNLAGLIVEPTKSGLPCVNLDLYRSIERQGVPLVFTDSRYRELSSPFVALNDEALGYEAAEYLIGKGHRHIMGVFTHSNRAGHARYLGYMKALSAHGLPLRDDRVHWYTQDDMRQVLGGGLFWGCLPECTAVLCYNDSVATMLLELLRERGMRVPEDLSIISIDNTALSQIGGFTSMIHPGERLGEAAAKLLLSMICGGQGESILFPPEMAERGSVRKLEGTL